MHTKDKLAEALEAAGLPEMAAKARTGYYHDFLSPLPDPALALDRDLFKVRTPAAMAVRARHHEGEFDATLEESEEWASGPEGRAAFERLAKGD
jgi:hypothetical protein